MSKVMIEMEMPKSCRGCKILNHGFCAVAYRHITTEEFDSDNRASWCPLQEVKEGEYGSKMQTL